MTQKKPHSAIVLAAGMGTRLHPITDTLPKALVRCSSRPLLSYALDFARHAVGPQGQIVVVGGYCAELVRSFLESEAKEGVLFVQNKDYEKGNLFSVAAGLTLVNGSFLLMNVDHIYPLAFADRLTETDGDIVAAVDFDRELHADDMKVKLNEARRVIAISKRLSEYDCGYIGMTLVRDAQTYRYALAATREKLGDSAVAENVLQELAERGKPATISDLSGMKWLEVDNLDDLRNAEKVLSTGDAWWVSRSQ